MAAEYNLDLTLYGTEDQLDKMLAVYKAYHGDRPVYFTWDALRIKDGRVRITAYGPYGQFEDLKEIDLFRELNEAAPDARFEGEISGRGQNEAHTLKCKLENGRLQIEVFSPSGSDGAEEI